MLKILKRLFPASWKQRVKNHLGVPSMNAGLLHLKNIGFQPAGVLDIGAYHGEWTVDFLHVFPNASVLMIEAQPAKEKTLQAISNKFPQVQYEMTLLGAHSGDKVHFYTNETASHAVLAA
ncbi:MAG TPA: hypothetical protein VFV37_10900, partial [Luteibaculaceae bacterium]|nr:hypothetical protein [Luteibaculaceae bacterium]